MSKRSVMLHITPLPAEISRESAVAFLHNHKEMIEMNPLVIRHSESNAPPNAARDEAESMTWYAVTDEIQYIPGTSVKSEVTYKAGFYDLPRGLQTHVFAPGGVDIRGKWSVGGNEPGEEREAVELGVDKPSDGLYVREDVELRCNVFLTNFVKKNLKKSHGTLVDRLIKKVKETQPQDPGPARPRSLLQTSSSSENVEMKRNTLIKSPVPYSQLYVPSSKSLSRNPTPGSTSNSNSSQKSQRVCSCLGTRHHPACRYFLDIYQQSDCPSPEEPYVSPLPRSAILSRSTTWEQTQTSAYALEERSSRCFCTGALHLQGCPAYPGLRFASRPSSPPRLSSNRDSQQMPYQVQFTDSGSRTPTPERPRPPSREASSTPSQRYDSPNNPYSRSSPSHNWTQLKPQPLMRRTAEGHVVLVELEGDAAQRYYEYQAQRAAELR